MSSIIHWIWLAEKQLSAKLLRQLLERFGDPRSVFFAEEKGSCAEIFAAFFCVLDFFGSFNDVDGIAVG